MFCFILSRIIFSGAVCGVVLNADVDDNIVLSEKTNLSLYRRILCLIVLGNLVVYWYPFSNLGEKKW